MGMVPLWTEKLPSPAQLGGGGWGGGRGHPRSALVILEEAENLTWGRLRMMPRRAGDGRVAAPQV